MAKRTFAHQPTLEERVNRAYLLLVLIGAASAAATDADALLPDYDPDDLADAFRSLASDAADAIAPWASCTGLNRQLEGGGDGP
jgi:hypothetical protein